MLNEVVPAVLELARKHQNGRGTGDVPSGTFSEYWFRTSGEETQAEIAERLNWGKSKVKKYSLLLNNTVPTVRDLARSHQDGRGTSEVPTGTFTEGWFRTSGLYDHVIRGALCRRAPDGRV